MFSKANTVRMIGSMAAPLAAALAATLTIGASAVTARATLIDVNYEGNQTNNMTGAAILGSSGDTWNNIPNLPTNPTNLEEVNGSSSGISVTNGTISGDFSNSAPDTANPAALMNGYIYSSVSTGVSITLSGLAANSSFQLVVYGAGNDSGQGDIFSYSNATGSWDNGISTTTGTSRDITVAGAEGINYVVFNGTTSTGSFTITATANKSVLSTNVYSMINGFQLETAVPEPTSLALYGSGGLALLLVGRRRRT